VTTATLCDFFRSLIADFMLSPLKIGNNVDHNDFLHHVDI